MPYGEFVIFVWHLFSIIESKHQCINYEQISYFAVNINRKQQVIQHQAILSKYQKNPKKVSVKFDKQKFL
jgi:hypothetical protein